MSGLVRFWIDQSQWNLLLSIVVVSLDVMTKLVKKHNGEIPSSGQDRVGHILSAARKRFAHYGFSKVTMDEVAADVGVVKGAIYYYFPTKESLFEGVIREEQKQFSAELQSMLAADKPCADTMYRYVDKRQEYFREMLNLSQLDFQSWMRVKSNFQQLFNDFEKQELGFLRNVLQKGHRSGEFEVSNASRMSELFLHVLQGLRLRALRHSNHSSIDDTVHGQLHQEANLFVDVFMNSIHTNGKRA